MRILTDSYIESNTHGIFAVISNQRHGSDKELKFLYSTLPHDGKNGKSFIAAFTR